MKTFIQMSLLAFALASPLAGAKQPELAIELIMDDSGVLIEAEQASHYKMAILAHLKRLARRRTEAHAQIDLISTSYGRTVWSGTPLELRRHPARAQDLVEKTRSEPTRCNTCLGRSMS